MSTSADGSVKGKYEGLNLMFKSSFSKKLFKNIFIIDFKFAKEMEIR